MANDDDKLGDDALWMMMTLDGYNDHCFDADAVC